MNVLNVGELMRGMVSLTCSARVPMFVLSTLLFQKISIRLWIFPFPNVIHFTPIFFLLISMLVIVTRLCILHRIDLRVLGKDRW